MLRSDSKGTASFSYKLPFVSILIPAYNPRFFREALGSAMCQEYPNLEVIVCDDSLGLEIRRILDGMPHTERVRYVKNPLNLGFSGNFSQCLTLAKGEYIKFLNDDDILHPGCVGVMVSRFLRYGERLKLVTSRRRRIDEHNQPLEDTFYTRPLAVVESLMNGHDLGNFVLKHSTNFIGEPTTAMFRKRDLDCLPHNIFQINGHEYICLADLSLWLRLLSRGDALYVPDELSFFRIHDNQEQNKLETSIRCVTERYFLLKDARSMGFVKDKSLHQFAVNAAMGFFDRALLDERLGPAERDELRSLRESLASELPADVRDATGNCTR